MAMYNYGVGGNEVKNDASEAISDISMNRTLFAQQLTANAPVKPQMVYDLKTVNEAFEEFKPNLDVEFESAEGATVKENLHFRNLGDFNLKSLTNQSSFLKDLNIQEEQYQKIMKQLNTNKIMKQVIENPEAKKAFMNALMALVQELDEK